MRPRKNMVDAAIVAAFVAGIAALGVSWYETREAANQRVQQAEARSVDLQAQQLKAYYEARGAACKVAGDWYMDDKPNNLLPEKYKQLLLEDMREQLRGCSIPFLSYEKPSSQEPEKALKEGGSLSGGGAGNAY